MTEEKKIHLFRFYMGDHGIKTACGQLVTSSSTSTDTTKVTCKKCRRKFVSPKPIIRR